MNYRKLAHALRLASLTGVVGIAAMAHANETIITDESLLVIGGSANGGLIIELETPQTEHCSQTTMVEIEDLAARAAEAFECGDELFGFNFNALDGGGANVGNGQRYTRVPRADKNGVGEWLNHFPERATGPNSESCGHCHIEPATGAGFSGLNAIRDPMRRGFVDEFINRNTPHLMGSGAVQLLAEKMTSKLKSRVTTAQNTACQQQTAVDVDLRALGTDFGSVSIDCDGLMDATALEGIDEDLIVKPFGWKGTDLNLRVFTRDAGHNELGMQATELVGDGVDGDGDGVANELTVGDISAMVIYVAGQVRPITKLELDQYGLMGLIDEEPLTADQRKEIAIGKRFFKRAGCHRCHNPKILLDETVFTEPSQMAEYRDGIFPAGQDPVALGVTPENPLVFDLTRDHGDNVFDIDGEEVRLGSFNTNLNGKMEVELYSDLKRHDMGPELAESIDEVGTGAATWITPRLWGVGSTAPYLHDGSASTLTEAILVHGGEGEAARQNFVRANASYQQALIAFLQNLVLIREE